MELTWWTALIVGTCIAFGVGSRWVLKSTDNVVEEAAEKIIKQKTGWCIDLSPDTPDPDHK